MTIGTYIIITFLMGWVARVSGKRMKENGNGIIDTLFFILTSLIYLTMVVVIIVNTINTPL